MSVVIDASVAAAFALPDEVFQLPQHLKDQLKRSEAIAPALWQIETLNILHNAVRRKRITADSIPTLLEILDEWQLQLENSLTSEQRNEVHNLATRHGLSAYDAVYLELSLRTKSSLASLDQDLLVAAKAEGVALAL